MAALTIGMAPFSLMVGTSVASNDTEALGGNNTVGDREGQSLTSHNPFSYYGHKCICKANKNTLQGF